MCATACTPRSRDTKHCPTNYSACSTTTYFRPCCFDSRRGRFSNLDDNSQKNSPNFNSGVAAMNGEILHFTGAGTQ